MENMYWSTKYDPPSYNNNKRDTLVILVCLIHFGNVLGGKLCVERGVVLLTIMSYSQHNVDRLLIKLHVSYVIKVIYIYSNISDRFTYIYFLFR